MRMTAVQLFTTAMDQLAQRLDDNYVELDEGTVMESETTVAEAISMVETARDAMLQTKRTELEVIHDWYTEMWNNKAADSVEPGWVIVEEFAKLFGADATAAAAQKLLLREREAKNV